MSVLNSASLLYFNVIWIISRIYKTIIPDYMVISRGMPYHYITYHTYFSTLIHSLTNISHFLPSEFD